MKTKINYEQVKKENKALSSYSLDTRNESTQGYVFERSAVDIADNHPAYTLGEDSELNTLLNPQEDLLFCEYLGNPCQNRACFQGTDKYNNCQIRKFKDKWGLNYSR